jgi:glyoxylate/hydroxypyruvate reductase A
MAAPAIKRTDARRIGFISLGLMARTPVLVLKLLSFPVSTSVRNPKPDAEVPIFCGRDQ